jgi:hypothetical protein
VLFYQKLLRCVVTRSRLSEQTGESKINLQSTESICVCLARFPFASTVGKSRCHPSMLDLSHTLQGDQALKSPELEQALQLPLHAL